MVRLSGRVVRVNLSVGDEGKCVGGRGKYESDQDKGVSGDG